MPDWHRGLLPSPGRLAPSPLSPFTAHSPSSLGSGKHPLSVTNENITTPGSQNPTPAPTTAPGTQEQWAHHQGTQQGQPVSANPWAQTTSSTGSNAAGSPVHTPPSTAYSPAPAPSTVLATGVQAWDRATDPGGPGGSAYSAAPAEPRGPGWSARRFGVKVLAGAAAVALVAGGVGGYAIGHTVAVSQISNQLGGTSDMMGPGTGKEQMGPGGNSGDQGGTPGGTEEGTGAGTGTSTGTVFAPTGESASTVDA